MDFFGGRERKVFLLRVGKGGEGGMEFLVGGNGTSGGGKREEERGKAAASLLLLLLLLWNSKGSLSH